MKMDDISHHVIPIVNQSDMLPDSDIPMMGRRRRKLTAKGTGRGVGLLSPRDWRALFLPGRLRIERT
jgi:hypothetical protein